MPGLQVVMGSRSDLKVVQESGMLDVLDSVVGKTGYEVSICSAHRNPEELMAFVRSADAEVFIAIAGMAAALPGAIAGASGMLPVVIGVPLDDHGVDSCLYMPPGVPVATAGVGKTGLRQAAILACQILVISDVASKRNLVTYLTATAKDPEFNINAREGAS